MREKKLLLFLKEIVLPMRTKVRVRRTAAERQEAKRASNAAVQRRKRARIAAAAAAAAAPSVPQPREAEAEEGGKMAKEKGGRKRTCGDVEADDGGSSSEAAGSEGAALVLPLKPDSIESSYISAMVSLWSDQCLEGSNCYPHPRGPLIKAFLEDLQIARASLRRAECEDRAISGLKDGYTLAEARKMSESLLTGLNRRPEEKTLRTRLDLLLLHSMMLRSESTRYAEFADLCSLRLDNEGPNCLAVIMQITQGKTLDRQDAASNRKTHYTGFLRHKDVFLCPVGGLALWLLFRWDIFGEDIPDFTNRSSWYKTKLIPGELRRSQGEISSRTQSQWIDTVFGEVGIVSSKILHTPRKVVARLLDLLEVPADQVNSPYSSIIMLLTHID